MFEDFWNAYPRKIGKLAAKRAYDRSLKHASPEEIAAGLAAFVEAAPWDGNLRFCPHPTTWLNQGRWADEHLEPDPPPKEWWERMDSTNRIREQMRRDRDYDA